MSTDCIFCKIANGEIPSEKIFEDEEIIAFNDINPAAPKHMLIVPKEHIPTLNDLQERHVPLIGKMFATAKDLAKKTGISESGYRTIINCNGDSGQEVFHIHLHVLGGARLGRMG
ncbi:MAG: histidine triad nucleotide-binding protein [Deltaproteobacteria bacterium]|jgi:histidine triad (HIT) family protein|nr:histidine triad nucleotide-binding protein [Deltaproteobacteria bacterium]